tara:strand:+ start:520 stop:777 length:258 start_codon:yes stop_codon:yes gene_type:complete
MKGDYGMNITHEERLEFLSARNDLRSTLDTLLECQDVWLSDVSKLEKLDSLMCKVLKFAPREDDNGKQLYYADWVLADDNNEKGE